MPALRDENRQVALIAQNLLGTSPIFITGVNLTNSHPMHVAVVDTDGNQLSTFSGLNIPSYDFVSMALSDGDTTETYTFKTGGSGGTTVATVAVVYTTSAREVISTVTKT